MAKLASKVYGDALFGLAVEENRVDEILEEIQTVRTVLKENSDLTKLMGHPEITKEEKVQIIENCFKGSVSDDVAGFLVIIVKKGRYPELDQIFDYVISQMKEYKHIGTATVVSPMELEESWKEKIRGRLLETTDYTEMEIEYQVDKSLIGGLVIRIGDRVVDSSLKYKLGTLKDQLLKITLEEQKEGGQAV